MSAAIRTSVELLPGKTWTWQMFVGWTGHLSEAQIGRFDDLKPSGRFGEMAIAEMRRKRGMPDRESYIVSLEEMTAEQASRMRTQLSQAIS